MGDNSRVIWSSAFVVIAMMLGYAVFNYAIPLLNARDDVTLAWGVILLLVVWPTVFVVLCAILRSIWKEQR